MQIRNTTNKSESFIDICKKNNLKVTPQRMTIYNILQKNKKHPSADSIYQEVKKQFPSISYDTVNRTLMTFSDLDIINIVEAHGASRRFDPGTENHHHFHCSKCNAIIDFYCKDFDRLKIPENIQKKFTIQNKRIVLKGLCNKCKNKKSLKTKLKYQGETL